MNDFIWFFQALWFGSFGALNGPSKPFFKPQPRLVAPVEAKPVQPKPSPSAPVTSLAGLDIMIERHYILIPLKPGDMPPDERERNDLKMKSLGLPTGYKIWEPK